MLMLFDSQEAGTYGQWRIVDDVVMGGRSQGNVTTAENGNMVFEGKVSLENNGGFSSIRLPMAEKVVSTFSRVCLRVKGDGKRYQFRLRANNKEYFSYIHYFETSGKWETIELDLAEFYPTWRGMTLDLPNYPGKRLVEITFLIANKTPEQFRLEVEKIYLSE